MKKQTPLAHLLRRNAVDTSGEIDFSHMPTLAELAERSPEHDEHNARADAAYYAERGMSATDAEHQARRLWRLPPL